jgi:hypothetical protein
MFEPVGNAVVVNVAVPLETDLDPKGVATPLL